MAKKTCPKCRTTMGCRTKICKCGYSFFQKRPTNITKKQKTQAPTRTNAEINQLAEAVYVNHVCCNGLGLTIRILEKAVSLARDEKKRRRILEN